MRTVALAGVVLAGIGGTYLVTTYSQAQARQTPQQVADQFIHAVIINDNNQIGHLMGVDKLQGNVLEQVFGKTLGAVLDSQAAKQAKDPADFKWDLTEWQVKNETVSFKVDLYQPNTLGRARKIEELLGYTTRADGTLLIPDPPPMSYEEAERQASQDKSILPLHYHVPLQLKQQGGRWIVDPEGKINDALYSVIRFGETTTDNEPYQIP